MRDLSVAGGMRLLPLDPPMRGRERRRPTGRLSLSQLDPQLVGLPRYVQRSRSGSFFLFGGPLSRRWWSWVIQRVAPVPRIAPH